MRGSNVDAHLLDAKPQIRRHNDPVSLQFFGKIVGMMLPSLAGTFDLQEVA